MDTSSDLVAGKSGQVCLARSVRTHGCCPECLICDFMQDVTHIPLACTCKSNFLEMQLHCTYGCQCKGVFRGPRLIKCHSPYTACSHLGGASLCCLGPALSETSNDLETKTSFESHSGHGKAGYFSALAVPRFMMYLIRPEGVYNHYLFY